MTNKNGDTRAARLTIELDRPRVLRVDLNALADIEEILGISIFNLSEGDLDAGPGLFEDMTVRQFRDVLWALLRDDDPELTKEQVGGLLDMSDMPRLMEAFGELFVRAMPEEPDAPLGSPAPETAAAAVD